MATIQCKQCGGEVDLPDGVKSGNCPYCNSLTTFPRITDERLGQIYDRAEHFRHIGDFDKASDAYEQLIQLDPEEPDYYWGLVLSRFGIEYVEDPVSGERIPTCHRVQYDSILADADYKNALEHASSYDRGIYEREAKRIAEIQKDILTLSAKEKPYDVFICYKESTDGGSRTKDSTLAQDIYYQLTNIGYKVFFARLTLEGKLGQQYEPYIFAALNSAKIMLVIGSKKEFFEAVWVKNEWSRFLALMKKDRSKLLIPCYYGMDPYDLPAELSMFQAQDMSKIGFLQDLIHGIGKVLNKGSAPAAPTAAPAGNAPVSVENLLKRTRFFLTDKNFAEAKEYCYKVLDIDPDNLDAFFLQFLAELKMSDDGDTPEFEGDPAELGCCKRVLASGQPTMKQRVEKILERCRRGNFFAQAVAALNQIEEDNQEKNLDDPFLANLAGVNELIYAVEQLEQAGDFGDAPNLLEQCKECLYSVVSRLISEEMIAEIADPNLAKSDVALCRVLADLGIKASPMEYNQTMAAMNEEGITQGEQDRLNDEFVANDFKEDELFHLIFEIFEALGDYRDSKELEQEFNERGLSEAYEAALDMLASRNYVEAIGLLEEMPGFRDSDALLEKAIADCYAQGVELMKRAKYKKALECFTALCQRDYENSRAFAQTCYKAHRKKVFVRTVVTIGTILVLASILHAAYAIISARNKQAEIYSQAVSAEECGHYQQAASLYGDRAISNYRDSRSRLAAVQYKLSLEQIDGAISRKHWSEAKEKIGLLLQKDRNDQEALKRQKRLREIAESRLAAAMTMMKKNGIASAVDTLRDAAELDSAQAQLLLGKCYARMEGAGMESSAFKWFHKAAKQGIADAQYELGRCYEYGTGTEKNPSEAFEWYRKAANQEHPGAQFKMGFCYQIGTGVDRDRKEAVVWYQKAADQEHPDALYYLGDCYNNGSGTKENAAKAVELYLKAAKRGHAMAQYKIGEFFERGAPEAGVSRNLDAAIEWYRRAAFQNHGKSDDPDMTNLAVKYAKEKLKKCEKMRNDVSGSDNGSY